MSARAKNGLIGRTTVKLIAPLLVLAVIFPLAISMFPRPSLVHDAYAYAMTAQRLVRHGYLAFGLGDPDEPTPSNAGVVPGWPIVLAGVYAMTGSPDATPVDDVAAAEGGLIALMFLFSAGIVFTATLTGRLLGGDDLGLLAGIMAAAYLPISWAATVSLAEHLGALLLTLQIYFALRLTAKDSPRKLRDVALFGALCGLTVLVRPNLVLWVLAPLAYVLVRRLESPKRTAALVAAAALGFCLALAPWWIRNAVALDSFVLLRSGIVAGGSSVASATPAPLPFAEGAWVKTSLSDDTRIMLHPWIPYADVLYENTYHYDTLRVDVPPGTEGPAWFRAMALPFTNLFHLLIVGFALASIAFIKRSPRLVMLIAAPVAVLAVHGTHLNARYLYPTTPAMVIAAAVAAYGLYKLASGRIRTSNPRAVRSR